MTYKALLQPWLSHLFSLLFPIQLTTLAYFSRLNPMSVSSKILTPTQGKMSTSSFVAPRDSAQTCFLTLCDRLEYCPKTGHSPPLHYKQNVLPCPTDSGLGHSTCFGSGM